MCYYLLDNIDIKDESHKNIYSQYIIGICEMIKSIYESTNNKYYERCFNNGNYLDEEKTKICKEKYKTEYYPKKEKKIKKTKN